LTALPGRVTILTWSVPARPPEEELALTNKPTATKKPPPEVPAGTVTQFVLLCRLLADESRLKVLLALAPGVEMRVTAL
jgi:hypothetical protein